MGFKVSSTLELTDFGSTPLTVRRGLRAIYSYSPHIYYLRAACLRQLSGD
jgi:hypothetical protein